jgi:hypothetical protein
MNKYNKNTEFDNTYKKLVSDLVGRCDFCKHQKYIGIYGKPCVDPEPCLYETSKKNWEHNGKFPNH